MWSQGMKSSTMPITLKLGELINAKPALERLIQLKFSIVTSYKLARRLKVINDALVTFEAKRIDLIRELGTPVAGKPDQVQVVQVSSEDILKAKKTAAKIAADIDEESIQIKASADKEGVDSHRIVLDGLIRMAASADAEVSRLEAGLIAWTEFNRRNNELLAIEETIAIDPIRLSELQSPENVLCKTCGRSPNEITVVDAMLLFPLLADDPS
jgi:hypothetical protein